MGAENESELDPMQSDLQSDLQSEFFDRADDAPPEGRVQEPFLNGLRKSRKRVNVFLRNGMRLEGVIGSFDQHVVQLTGSGATTTIYKHMIATILPAVPRPRGEIGQSRDPAKPKRTSLAEGARRPFKNPSSY